MIDHFVKVKTLIAKNDIDPQRLFNIDENGISPEKTLVRRKRKYFGQGRIRCEQRQAEFQNVSLITVLPTISAYGTAICPLLVFKGQSLPFLEYECKGVNMVQSFASFLPTNSIVTTRKQYAGVDSFNFLTWAEYLVENTAALRQEGRKVLSVFDRYTARDRLNTLIYLDQNGLIAYGLPSHTSGAT